MQKNADITFKENTFVLTGDLDFANVMSVYRSSLPAMIKNKELHFDFSQLKSSDSSGLALIIEWIKFATANHKSIRFSHLSKDLMSIAKAAGLDKLIIAE